MIYFTADALKKILSGKKFFYITMPDGCHGMIYKQDEAAVKKALEEKKDKYNSKCSIYELVDETAQANDIYWLGVSNKRELENKFSKILPKEGLNALNFRENNKNKMLILSDADIQKGEYKNVKADSSKWPIATANDDAETLSFLCNKIKHRPQTNDVADVVKLLPRIATSKTQAKSFAKDDIELVNIRKEKIRKEFEPFIKKSKDDLDFLVAKKNDIKELGEFLPSEEVKKFNLLVTATEDLQRNYDSGAQNITPSDLENCFKIVKANLKNLNSKDPMLAYFNKFVVTIGKLKNDNLSQNVVDETKKIVEQMYSLKDEIKE